jgi:hypothetical protein
MSMIVHGTDDTTTDPVPVVVGDWSLLLVGGAVRVIRWRGVEVVRGIDCPIRDPQWVTLLPEAVTVTWADDGARRVMTRTFAVGNGALDGHLTLTIDPVGTIDLALALHARAAFRTMRSGFTVLHPIAGVAGAPVRVRHSDGSSEETRFPAAISPSQPVFDIVGLTHEIGGVRVDVAFGGEVFEMEDQRNWADASYKTYCRPLSRPRPYDIAAGETVHQTIRLSVHGAPMPEASTGGDAPSAAVGTFPDLMLAVEEGWAPDANEAHPSLEAGVRHLLVRLGSWVTGDEGWVAALGRHGAQIDLEVVIPEGVDAVSHLTAVAARLRGHGIEPRNVMALPEAYLQSYQPTEVWPTGTSPTDAARAAQIAFPHASIGVGMLTNFTEVNRCRPDDLGDYVTHSTTAIVHAADDLSVFETLETLPQIFAQDATFARGTGGHLTRTVRPGLMSIGTRSNAYPPRVVPNPERVRRTVALEDPRQVGLIAAAYAVGVAGAVVYAGAAAWAPAALTGPFGIAGAAVRYPIFFAVQALGRCVGKPLAALPAMPHGAHGVAVTDALTGRVRAVIANGTAGDVTVHLPEGATWRCLDEVTAPAAAIDARWLDGPPATAEPGGAVTLSRYAVVFASWPNG